MRTRWGWLLGVGAILGAATAATTLPSFLRKMALQHAASDFCACMLGMQKVQTFDVEQRLSRVQLALLVQTEDAAPWPRRCGPYAKPAINALVAGGAHEHGTYDSAAIVDALDHAELHDVQALINDLLPYAVLDPAPSVPVPPTTPPPVPRLAAFSEFKANRCIFDVGRDSLRVTLVDSGGGEYGMGTRRTYSIDTKLNVTPYEDVPALEREPGAPALDWRDGNIVRADGTVATEAPGHIVYGRVLADGRVVFVAEGVEVNERLDFGKDSVYEYANGKLAKNPIAIPHTSSTHFVDGWAIWKDHSKPGPAAITVMNLADGARAAPRVIASVEQPLPIYPGGWQASRGYSVCRSTATFVDMDPTVAVFAGGAWSAASLIQPPGGRHIDCQGDVAWVTDWAPPDVERCDAKGCARAALPPSAGELTDEFASDGAVLYQLEPRRTAITLSIQPLPAGQKHIVLLGRPAEIQMFGRERSFHGDDFGDLGSLHVFHGQAIVALRRTEDDHPVLLAINHDGSTHAIVPPN